MTIITGQSVKIILILNLLNLMQFQQTKNTAFNSKGRVRLKQISPKTREGKFPKASHSINLDFDQYFSPWGNQDNNKMLLPYSLHKKQKAHSVSFSTSTHLQFSTGQERKPRYHQKPEAERKNVTSNEKVFKMSPLEMHLDQQTIYSPHKKYGMTDLFTKLITTRENHKQMPNRVKILKQTLLKFQKCFNQEESDRIREKQMFSTCLTDKFSRDLVADTLTINSAIANRGYKATNNLRNEKSKEQNKVLPRLIMEEKSVKQEKNSIDAIYKKKLGFQGGVVKKQLKMKQFIMRRDQDQGNQNKPKLELKEHSSKAS